MNEVEDYFSSEQARSDQEMFLLDTEIEILEAIDKYIALGGDEDKLRTLISEVV